MNLSTIIMIIFNFLCTFAVASDICSRTTFKNCVVSLSASKTKNKTANTPRLNIQAYSFCLGCIVDDCLWFRAFQQHDGYHGSSYLLIGDRCELTSDLKHKFS